jgi:hypothetical protein
VLLAPVNLALDEACNKSARRTLPNIKRCTRIFIHPRKYLFKYQRQPLTHMTKWQPIVFSQHVLINLIQNHSPLFDWHIAKSPGSFHEREHAGKCSKLSYHQRGLL